MKTAALIFALFLLVKPIIPVLEYAAFYDYIKNELCINQDKPELACNGKCHLKKELAKASNSETGNENSHSITVEQSIVFFQNTINYYDFVILKEQNPKINASYNAIYKYHYMNFIFHPPLI
ncbi:hypothetical protein AAFN75_11635 [Algibacter sp. AS12]|uniref:hypothetical protein n=1 Tax=Algibacter sp. AS12 TaxID=3135773 RepID=UPI00398B1CF8